VAEGGGSATAPHRGYGGITPDLTEALERWRADLASWAIPEEITAAVSESPWVLSRPMFARRADRLRDAPFGPSYELAWAALDPEGTVLDVGAGAGAASLPLLPRAVALTAVDADAAMLRLIAQRSAAMGIEARCVLGRWPEVAAVAAPADVVTCHNVLYNVPEVAPFLTALTRAARRLVVVEMTARHPLTALNPLWLTFHELRRPESPTADDILEILAAMGVLAAHERWRRPPGRDWASFEELTDATRRQLCLPPDRAAAVARALIEAGVDPEHPASLGSADREVVTIWWDGAAAR
jgi:SAM-dependent methyltransferase